MDYRRGRYLPQRAAHGSLLGRTFGALGVLVAGVLASACAPAAPTTSMSTTSPALYAAAVPAPPVKLMAAYSAIGGAMAPAWFAAAGGYFSERGLDVELRYIPSGAVLT